MTTAISTIIAGANMMFVSSSASVMLDQAALPKYQAQKFLPTRD